MSKPFIFISCGQYLSEEKQLGLDIKKTIETRTPFDGYFAEDQSSVNGLVANILERLYNCAGLVAVMHPRGTVTDEKGDATVRASVWIEQEIAMAALVQQLVRREKNDLKVAAYVHYSIKMEGIRTLLHLNPIPFEKDEFILADLRARLPEWKLSQSASIKNLRWRQYEEQVGKLQPEHMEGLRILVLEGPSNDNNVLNRIKQKGLASSWAGLFEGLFNSSGFIQPVSGQPPANRQRSGERMWQIKPEALDFLEYYFSTH